MSVVHADPPRAARGAEEAKTRARLRAGERGLGIRGMREKPARKGSTYRPAEEG